LGELPRKRHIVFRQPDGSLYNEHVMGSRGFSGPESLLYHRRPPTAIISSRLLQKCEWVRDDDPTLRMRHFATHSLPLQKSVTLDRSPLLFNADVAMSYVQPTTTDAFFYRNAQGDELVYVSEGTGVLETMLGDLSYQAGDYVIIPRGITHRWKLGDKPPRMLVIESTGQIRPPSRYVNEVGQYVEHSPYCERDIRRPTTLQSHNETGEFPVVVKQNDAFTEVILDHYPFDVIGWDGNYYPWILSIHDFEPIVGSLHQPPPVHQTFQGDGFVVCSFVPRLFDFHPEAVPAPYNHSNVNSDEVIYYANNEFMSRKGISYGSLTLHPGGLPHGPHPGRVEASIGKKRTDELAVMLDTFRPLQVGQGVQAIEDPEYAQSWFKHLAK
jgi:homogentisate 1,2-dioxygenase